MPEGEMTRKRAACACEKSLHGFAKEINLGKFILLGKGEERTGGRNRPSILADAFEAVIGAIYLDGGLESAKDFVLVFVEKAAYRVAAGIAEAPDLEKSRPHGEENTRAYQQHEHRYAENIVVYKRDHLHDRVHIGKQTFRNNYSQQLYHAPREKSKYAGEQKQ